MKVLTDRIREITVQAGGKWGISLFDLDRNESWGINEQEHFYSASVIKVPIMIAAFARSQQGEIKLGDQMVLKREDIVGGSGVLQYLTPGTKFSIYDLITLMIIQSDNTATNILIDLLGTKYIQETMEAIGLEKSKFYHKMMTMEVDREGRNTITAQEMTDMLRKLVTGKIISVYACEHMIEIMKKQQIRDSLPVKIPKADDTVIGALPEWELANKTGNVLGIRHDIGIFYVEKRTFIASILTSGLDELESPELIGRVGLEIYHYLKQEN
ncbi:serine hydrolase [Ornithinibacillus massiliensis]|uniref:Serine hydrolase n=1 Tax=Ornithinibacillus massiliensis TaxID=1944633 RepID=A0ABS5MAB8_9BACI|nr:serine hydrolase [Ornithinibacillus massiliensis]MBS3679259.1 serine hydrolase [Ornithinibacillus massiliensis]